MHRKQMFRIIIGILAIMALTLILGGSAWAQGSTKRYIGSKADRRPRMRSLWWPDLRRSR